MISLNSRTTELYDHNVTILTIEGNYARVVRMAALRKKGYEKQTEKIKREDCNTEKLASSISRSKKMVRQYGRCNPWDWFVTLTFDPQKYNRFDFETIQKALAKFINNYNQRKKNPAHKVRYLLIPEMHEDGAWHLHGFFDGIDPNDLVINENGYIEWKQYRKKFGFISMSKIKDLDKATGYIMKYISKDMARTVTDLGAHLYYASQGLEVGKELYRGTGMNLLCAPDYVNEDWGVAIKEFDTREVNLADFIEVIE